MVTAAAARCGATSSTGSPSSCALRLYSACAQTVLQEETIELYF